MSMTEQLLAIRERHSRATRGPWRWFGNTSVYNVYLATVDRGRIFVMGFRRWGMRGAQSTFQVHQDGCNGGVRIEDCFGCGTMEPASDLAQTAPTPCAGCERCSGGVRTRECRGCGRITEVARIARVDHNADIVRIDNPDADLIEHSWADLNCLLGIVDRFCNALGAPGDPDGALSALATREDTVNVMSDVLADFLRDDCVSLEALVLDAVKLVRADRREMARHLRRYAVHADGTGRTSCSLCRAFWDTKGEPRHADGCLLRID